MIYRFSILFIIVTALNIGCNDFRKNDRIVAEKFEPFLNQFNKDSVFQISRIKFPILVTEFDVDDLQTKKKIITQKEYNILDLSYQKSFSERELDKYNQHVKQVGNKAIIEIRGIDNGIHCDIVFEKENGKWYLVSWSDSST